MKQALEIPVVDLETGEDELISSIGRACREWGFFQVVHHNVDRELRDRFFAETSAFFALPQPTKNAVARTERNPWGYYDRELTKNKQDWKEIFDFGYDQENESIAQWPDGQDGFKAAMLDWFTVCESVSLRLLRLIALSLNKDADQVARYFQSNHTSFLRLNYYPVCSDPAPEDVVGDDFEGHLGISRHTDAGALTVLVQDEVASLQVRHKDEWSTVKPLEDAFIVNIGDLFQVWSNDLYLAPEHRVLARSDVDRISAPFFLNPDFETNCVPLIGDKPLYRPVNWGEFRAARALGDYADYGREVQVTDYYPWGLGTV